MRDAAQPRRVGLEERVALSRVAVLDGPAHEGLQHLQAAVAESAVVQVPEDHVALAEQAVAFHHLGKATGGERQHGLAAFEPALVEALAARAVHRAVGEHAVDPAFQDGGHGEPPERKLQDQQLAAQELVDFALDVVAEPLALGGLLLFAVVLQLVGEAPLGEVGRVGHGVEAHGVKVGELDGVACFLQHVQRGVEQGAIEGARLGVGVDDQGLHAGGLPRRHEG